MEGGLLSLKWNNHKSTFFHVLSNVRKKKDNYADATLACDGQFYPVHKLVLSSCSDYFEEMFAQAGQAKCKHPFIVLKDIKSDELECLLSYMYIGEVNVVQEKLSGLIKAAECLRIKGLAVPDEEPPTNSKPSREKRHGDNSVSSESKRRKQEDISHSTPISRDSYSRSEERRKHSADSNSSNKFRNSSSNINNTAVSDNNLLESIPAVETLLGNTSDVKSEHFDGKEDSTDEVLLDEPPNDEIKAEPPDQDSMYEPVMDHKDQMLIDGFEEASGDNQQHFMDQLLANSAEQHHLGDFTGEGDPSLSAGGSQQQPMVHFPESLTNETPNCDLLPFEQIVENCKVPGKGSTYTCFLCHKTFHRKPHFRYHYRIHTGERPFSCLHCDYRTTSMSNLYRHIRSIHKLVPPSKMHRDVASSEYTQ